MKDTLNQPIEYICATYSTEGLEALFVALKDPFNIAAVADELSMRHRAKYGIPDECPVEIDEPWDYLGEEK